jgi:hypothetical protein
MKSVITWGANWAWAIPLTVLTVTVHVVGLGMMNMRLERVVRRLWTRSSFSVLFVTVISGTALFATVLLAFEASLWAALYRGLNAMPTNRTAMLFSLNAITALGHTELDLPDEWRLLSALEALNGLLLFGLTTAFLYEEIHRLWAAERARQGKPLGQS